MTVNQRVDFAPGKFDLESSEGKARLGEEAAHAVQQSTQPSHAEASEPELEGEAKQAGADFAAGRAPSVEMAAPAGMALAEGPTAPTAPALKDTDPSPEVPDLTVGEVKAIKAALKTDKALALQLTLKALQRIDSKTFHTKDISGGKMQAGGGSTTGQGPAFEAWLETYLDGYATKLGKTRGALNEAEVKAAVTSASVPADKKDIKVIIGSGHFASVSLLYSTVRHEWVHVEQLRADYLAHIPTSIMPSGVDSPDSGTTDQDRELEAYLWEMEHLATTGLTNPSEMHLLWESCSNAWLNAGPAASKKYGARFKAAFKTVWGKAMDGHLAEISAAHAVFVKSGTVADKGRLRTLQRDMDQLWSYRNNHSIVWAPYQSKYETAQVELDAMVGEVKGLLDKADAALKSTDPADTHAAWYALLSGWINLDAKIQAKYQARFDKTAVALWKHAFDLNEKKLQALLTAGNKSAAKSVFSDQIYTLYANARKSGVDRSPYTTRYKAMEKSVR